MANQFKRKSKSLNYQISTRSTKMMCKPLSSSLIVSLPNDLLIEVLAKVASSSYVDLVRAKLATKLFLHASNDRYIFRHVSLKNESFRNLLWNNTPEFWSFVETCNNNENPESLYRKGMLEFFTHCNEASGLACLKLSAQKGYVDACYVYGVVLYAADLVDEGLAYLKMCEVKLGNKMAECRRRVKEFVWYFWVKNKISIQSKTLCNNRTKCRVNERRDGWDWKDEDDYYGEHTCEECKWKNEVSRFCNMLRSGGYSN
uniref:At2g35280-like TPR domain-containing protein n=1 Tax=Cucumis melo TaxID=3656 RepID=A0A9I9D2C5_CUCME